ncbi:MAG TPA: hypothetical protein PK230_01200 [Chitinophagales bacterium]|nr:hypothetical protein [Chitinophagales bacterium]
MLTIDFDTRWKELIYTFVEEFIQYFLPDLYEDVDFSVAPEFLEQELHKLFADEERKGKKISDKLIKVRLKNGEDSFVLVHVEIEGDAPSHYSREVFKYYYRIYDRYEADITTLVIYVGDQVPLLHNVYNKNTYGTKLSFEFNSYVVKNQTEADLLASPNICALAVLANLYVLQSKNDYAKRFGFKRQLLNLLVEKNYSRKSIVDIFAFIRLLMLLPEELEQKLITEIFPTMKFVSQARMMFVNEYAVEVYGKTFEQIIAEKEQILAQQQEILAQQQAEKEQILAQQQEILAQQQAEIEQHILRMHTTLHIDAEGIAIALDKPVMFVQSVLDKHKK